mmetsp:Transcript_16724/g.35177  ORF Transcript_16724/g.35177 Transcript_16724/m.35177 type:complete len:124 (-) Transcript_16724:584-955(-)
MGGGKRNCHNATANNKKKNQHYNKQQQHKDYNPTRQTHTDPEPLSPSSHSDDSDEEEITDFCQHFFGDPLFSNMNVLLLFLTTTFLPMIVWIPHFLSEYQRLRHMQDSNRIPNRQYTSPIRIS